MTIIDKKTLGRRIRQAREARDITQKELGKRVNIVYSGISDIERGQRDVQVAELGRIAEALEVSVRALVPEWFEDEMEEDKRLRNAYWLLPSRMRPDILTMLESVAHRADND